MDVVSFYVLVCLHGVRGVAGSEFLAHVLHLAAAGLAGDRTIFERHWSLSAAAYALVRVDGRNLVLLLKLRFIAKPNLTKSREKAILQAVLQSRRVGVTVPLDVRVEHTLEDFASDASDVVVGVREATLHIHPWLLAVEQRHEGLDVGGEQVYPGLAVEAEIRAVVEKPLDNAVARLHPDLLVLLRCRHLGIPASGESLRGVVELLLRLDLDDGCIGHAILLRPERERTLSSWSWSRVKL